MQFIKLKGVQANRYRKNGTKEITPLFITKNHKYGEVQSETTISKKKNIIITGEHDSGKTKSLFKLYGSALDIWGGHNRATGKLYLDNLQPITEWYDKHRVAKWYAKTTGQEWQRLKAYEKAKLLPKYCKENKAVLCIDNADRLTGRKLNIAKQCILSAKVTIATVQSENRLSPSIRQVLLKTNPQFLRLETQVAYDATNVVVWGLIAICIMAGMWEVAFVLGGVKLLGNGRGASKSM